MCICVLHFLCQLLSSSGCMVLPQLLETGDVLCGCSGFHFWYRQYLY